MALTFYYLSGSPFSWKVWLSLERKDIAYDLKILSADAGDLKTPQFLAINPRGKVPVIIDDGFELSESSAIIEYLEEQYPASGSQLWPAEAKVRALARKTAIEGDSFIYPSVRRLVVELLMRNEGEPDVAGIAVAKTALARELATLEHKIQGPFIAGVEPSAADFAIYPFLAVLGRVAVRKPKHQIGTVVPDGLKLWMRGIEGLPYFNKTIPPHWRNS